MDQNKSQDQKKGAAAAPPQGVLLRRRVAKWRQFSDPKEIAHMDEHIRVAMKRHGRVIVQKGKLKSNG